MVPRLGVGGPGMDVRRSWPLVDTVTGMPSKRAIFGEAVWLCADFVASTKMKTTLRESVYRLSRSSIGFDRPCIACTTRDPRSSIS